LIHFYKSVRLRRGERRGLEVRSEEEG